MPAVAPAMNIVSGATAAGRTFLLDPDLHETLAKVDQFEHEALGMIDGYIQQAGLAAPVEELPQLRDGYDQTIIEELDVKAAGISTVIWAMGYTFDYSLVKLPVRDADGFPIQTNGATRYPGLSFVGMPWMPSEKSGFLLGSATLPSVSPPRSRQPPHTKAEAPEC